MKIKEDSKMAFYCPVCSGESLKISFSLELPPSDDDDEITLQTVQCARCGFSGLAVYRENRRGSMEQSSWRHRGYEVEREATASLSRMLSQCPSPRNPRCGCRTHESLSRYDWATVASNFAVKEEFEMRLVPNT